MKIMRVLEDMVKFWVECAIAFQLGCFVCLLLYLFVVLFCCASCLHYWGGGWSDF